MCPCRCLHVSNLGSCSFHVPEDLGVDPADAEQWCTGRAVCVPVLGSSGTALAILLVARKGFDSDFNSEEVELLAWLAVLLGRVVEDSDDRSSLEGAIAVAGAGADQVVQFLLDRPGVGEGLDPHLDGVFSLGDSPDRCLLPWPRRDRGETAKVLMERSRSGGTAMPSASSAGGPGIPSSISFDSLPDWRRA